jgi:hypothetical protein
MTELDEQGRPGVPGQVPAGRIGEWSCRRDPALTGETPEHLTHVLRSDVGRPTIGGYRKLLEQPVDDELLRTITSWTVSRMGPSRTS